MIGPRTLLAFVIVNSFLLTAETQGEPSKFILRVIKVERKGDGCIVDAQSNKRKYKLSSDIPAACAMLQAGEDYKAMRLTVGNDPKEESKDTPVLVVYNNVQNPRRQNSVFNINSEEAIKP